MFLINRRSVVLGGVVSLIGSQAVASFQPLTAIIFVGASWCPACKQAAPVCKVFGARHQLPILVASQDARPIEPFTEFVDAQNHPIAASVQALPTTLVYSSSHNTLVGGFEGYRSPQWYLTSLLQLVREAEGLG